MREPMIDGVKFTEARRAHLLVVVAGNVDVVPRVDSCSCEICQAPKVSVSIARRLLQERGV